MWAFIGAVADLVWGALQTTYDYLVIALQWSVKVLWSFAVTIYNGLVDAGALIGRGFKAAWGFLDNVFTHVLPQAWTKFWTLFDRFRSWLKDVFSPVFGFLRAVRDDILGFYKDWVRPLLDIIDASRAILRVLEALHLAWAKKLDDWLGGLEAAINYPFKQLLDKLNSTIDWVNRIETADGLFQRVAHIRTLQRDIVFATRVLTNSRVRALSDDEKYRIFRAGEVQSVPQLTADLNNMWTGQGQSYTDDVLTQIRDDTAAYWA